MNSQIINWLNNQFGYTISNDYYSKIDVWKDWWKGFHQPFHRIVYENGEKRKKPRYVYHEDGKKGLRGLGGYTYQ